jgi:thiol-disulfide isomerase/thioredoxin
VRLRHAIVLVVAALVGAACTGGPTETRTIRPTDAHTTGPTIILTSPMALNATDAPLLPRSRFALPEFDYGTFQQLLTQLKGTPVVVNIWASWCGPCREEAGKLAAAAREFGSRVQFIGVDIGDQREAAQQTIRDFGWSYPSIFDPNEDVKHGLGLLGQPDTLFYDRQGNPVTFTYRGTNYSAFSGPIPSQAALDSVIRQLLR